MLTETSVPFVATVVAFAVLAGCNPNNSCEIWSAGGPSSDLPEHWTCWADEWQEDCEAMGGGLLLTAFYPDQSCLDLGYANQCTEDELDGALQDEWTAGPNCDSSVPPVGHTPGSGGGNGPCLVGNWASDPIPTCLQQSSTITFVSSGTSRTNSPECAGMCALSETFVEFTWETDDENSGTLTMHYGRSVACGEEYEAPPVTVSVPFSCEGGSATIDGTPWNRQ